MIDLDCWQEKFENCIYSNALLSKLSLINEHTGAQIELLTVRKAIYYAKEYHGDQKRQTGEPYYTHPLAVAAMVADYCLEVDAIVAAILHDVVEDTDANIDEISNVFGYRVAQIVERLTRFRLSNCKISSGELIMQAYTANDAVAVLVKLLDRIHNLQTLHVKSKEKQQKTLLEVLETFFLLSFKIDHRLVNKFCDYLRSDTTIQKQTLSIFSYGTYRLQSPTFQNNF